MAGLARAAQGAGAARVRLVPKAEPQDEAAQVARQDAVADFGLKPLMSRREAEILFEIDGAQTGESLGWKMYFVESLVEYLVFGSRPTGRISEDDAKWLLSLVGEDWSPSVPALMRALVLQAEDLPQGLIAFAMRCGAMRTTASSLV